LVEEGAKEGFIEMEEKEIIDRTLDLSESDVKEIMVPKDEIFALQEDTKVKDAIALLREKKFSRIPVYGKDLDDIKGILYAKRIIPLKLKKQDFGKPVKEFIDPPFFVTEFKRIDQLLEEMQRSKRHLAIVIDEYGNTVGIVTLDDILSYLFGKMPDEFKKQEEDFEPISEHRFRVSASMSIEEFKEHFGLEEKLEEEEEVDTVGGLIMKLLGRVPKEGDFVVWRNFKFIVEKMEGNRIKKIQVEEIS
jgi:CBS domain containing-hemolysin-like protein